MASLIANIGKANPESVVNNAFVNAIMQQAFGRPATAAELKKYTTGGWKVKDVSNTLLGKNSPFSSVKGAQLIPANGGTRKTVSPLAPNDTGPGGQTPTTNTTTNTSAKYSGNGNKPGQLPKQDATGKYSWVDANGQEQHQPGYNAGTGSWDYLGDHSPFEWTAAETLYKNSPPPPKPFTEMTDTEKLTFLNQAHQEMAQNFTQAVQQGQTDLVHELGQAVDTFGRAMDQNNLGTTADIKAAQNALEAAGLTFQGGGKEILGEGFAGAGQISPDQLTTLQSNLAAIQALPGTAQTGGTVPNAPAQPVPPEIASGQAVTEDQKQAAWQAFYTTDAWKQYRQQVDAVAASGTGNGVAGTGQYGYSGNLDPYAGTGLTSAAAQGSLFQNAQGTGRTQLAESYRRNFNTRSRDLGMAAEQLIGSSNINSLNLPSIGGQRSVNAAPNVLGSDQSGYQTNTTSRANQLYGNFMGQYGYTFRV